MFVLVSTRSGPVHKQDLRRVSVLPQKVAPAI
jgi:hypothetical protein